MDKLFFIGFNKTATTTIAHILRSNFISTHHSCGNKWLLDKHDAFLDDPKGILDYANLSIEYPNAKFILTCRNLRKWCISRFKHGMSMKFGGESWILPMDAKCKLWIEQRDNHHKSIVNFFQNQSNRLIICDVGQEKWIDFLCDSLLLENRIYPKLHVRPYTKLNNVTMNKIYDVVDSTFSNMNLNQHEINSNFMVYLNDHILRLMSLYKNNLK